MIPYPQISSILIQIGPFAIRWYGLMYLFSFIAAGFLTRKVAAKRNCRLTTDQISDLLSYVAIGVILGGRLGYVLFYNAVFYLNHPFKIMAVWEGGMSFHGGLLGAIVAGLFFCRREKLPYYEVADVAILSVPIGLGLGRIGNFINGELFGRPTDLPWCMVFPQADALCRHPSQLYQAFLEGVILFSILWWLSKKKRETGLLFWSFILFYGLFRFWVEFVRQPDGHIGFITGPFSMGQLLSFPMLVVGMGKVGWLIYKGRSSAIFHA